MRRDRATYQKPSEPNEGISFVLVNGVEAVKKRQVGRWSGAGARGSRAHHALAA